MLSFLSVLSGILIAVMIVQNGGLGAEIGNYHTSVFVHVVGLASILLWMLFKRDKLRWDRSTRWYYYIGGILGVITVVSNNLCFASLGVSLTLALGLLGQCATGGIADHFGLFGLPRLPFRRQHLLSLGFIIAGIAIMYLV